MRDYLEISLDSSVVPGPLDATGSQTAASVGDRAGPNALSVGRTRATKHRHATFDTRPSASLTSPTHQEGTMNQANAVFWVMCSALVAVSVGCGYSEEEMQVK